MEAPAEIAGEPVGDDGRPLRGEPHYTIIDVYAPDSVGFLYRVTETMSELGLTSVSPRSPRAWTGSSTPSIRLTGRGTDHGFRGREKIRRGSSDNTATGGERLDRTS